MADKTDRTKSEQLIEKFQCPGCVYGSDIECGAYEPDDSYGSRCAGHVLGTMFGLGNSIALGLPKGFNKSGPDGKRERDEVKPLIRLWTAERAKNLEWNSSNVPVWALHQDGDLFVRTYMPRVNDAAVDVIEGGRVALTDAQVDALDEHAIDVGDFIDEID